MDSGYYAAVSGLLARTDSLDIAAGNLANVNTTAYKSQQSQFLSVLADSNGSANAISKAINDYGVLGGSRTDFAAGNMEHTGNDLDLAIQGRGFFAVQTKSGERYTRNGNFSVSLKGALMTSSGDLVLGETGPIQVPSGPMTVSADGTISSASGIVAKLRLVDFPDSALTAEGQSYFNAPQNQQRPAAGAQVQQGSLEASNLNPVAATVNLISIQRNAEMLQKALSMFQNELNKTAVQDLPRVS